MISRDIFNSKGFVKISQCWNYGNSISRKNFMKVTVLLNKLLKSWFDEIFFWWERISCFSTPQCGNCCDAQCGKTRTSLSPKKIFHQSNSLVIYLVKPFLSRNFYQKYLRENSCNLYTVYAKVSMCSTTQKQDFYPGV